MRLYWEKVLILRRIHIDLRIMKKFFVSALVASSSLLVSSCYCDKMAVGNVSNDEPLVHVASERNHHFIGGLVVKHDKLENHLPGVRDYVVERKISFWDGFVTCITWGIYTPSTTKFYVPKSNPNVVVEKEKFMSKAYQGHLKK